MRKEQLANQRFLLAQSVSLHEKQWTQINSKRLICDIYWR